MNEQTRITLDDTMSSALVKMCEGNPGALIVLLQCVQQEPVIDPDSILSPMGAVFALDSHGIYGAKIWILYKEVCGSNVPRMIGVLRAVQLGFLNERPLLDAVDEERRRGGAKLKNIGALLAQVKERLPKFNLEPTARPEVKP